MKLTGSEYEAIVEASPNMIWRAGLDANCNYFNETWLRFTGKTMEQEVGAGWLEGVHPEDKDCCMDTYLAAFERHESFEMEYRLKRHDGLWRWINDRGVPMFDAGRRFTGYIGSCMDVTEKIEGRKLIDLAHYDTLTGVFNRNYLEILIDFESKNAKKEQYPVSAILIDVDNFKYFNDQYGHDFGDKVLSGVASLMAGKLRESDYIGRYGGDEFLIILPRLAKEEASGVAQRILDALPCLNVEGSREAIGVSMGIAEHAADADLRATIKRADDAMFRAKKNGGNQYSFS